jgi:hypothetical protein
MEKRNLFGSAMTESEEIRTLRICARKLG